MTPYIRMRMANKGLGDFRADGNVIWLYDVIAADEDEAHFWGGVSPRQFIAALSSIDGPATLRINSPGGSVFGAQAMVAAMRAHPHPITARVESLAASAASVIAAECAECVMVPGAMMMIHKAWGLTVGNGDDHRSVAELLDKVDAQIAATYARRAGAGAVDDFLRMMAAETWFDATEAVEAKLADAVDETNAQRPQAQWDLSAYHAAPWAPAEPAQTEKQGAAEPASTQEHLRAQRIRRAAAIARRQEI